MTNCLIIEDEVPAQKILKAYINDLSQLSLIACCNNALDAIELIEKEKIDLIFLDIHLPKLSGLNFLRSLKNPPMVIITSAYPQYALEGFELDVLDYLLKPFSFERFFKAVNKASVKNTSPTIIETTSKQDHIFIKMERSLQKINLVDIQYIQSDKDFVKIHINDKFYLELQTLKHYEDTLPSNFIRVHKSYIINLDQLELLEATRLKIGAVTVPIGRNYKDALNKKLGLS